MKTAEELEKELRVIGENIASIAFRLNVRHADFYAENDEFLTCIDNYKSTFEQLYIQAESENYYWVYCSVGNYHTNFDKRIEEFLTNNVGADPIDFYKNEEDNDMGCDHNMPILLLKDSVYLSDKYVELDFINNHYFNQLVFQKRLENDKKNKWLYLEEKRALLDELVYQEEQENRNRILEFISPSPSGDLEGGCSTIAPVEKSVDVNVSNYLVDETYNKQGELSDKVKKAWTFYRALSAKWLSGYDMLSSSDYDQFQKEMIEMICIEDCPKEVVRVENIASNQFISRLFWEIHNELYTTRSYRSYFFEYIKKKFKQFDNQEISTMKNKFKTYVGDFEADFHDVTKYLQKK